MTTQVFTCKAWLLHSRPFRDTSLLVDLLTLERGRVAAIAKGVRNARSKGRATLQLFMPLQVGLAGKHELQALRSVEAIPGAPFPPSGERLFAGLYINELLVKLFHGHEAEASLFDAYEQVIFGLGAGGSIEPLLRSFELQLLDCLGYGLQLDFDAESGEPVLSEAWYFLRKDGGLARQLQVPGDMLAREEAGLIPGREVIKLQQGRLDAPSTLKYAKRLLRTSLHRLLDGRELASRELFKRKAEK